MPRGSKGICIPLGAVNRDWLRANPEYAHSGYIAGLTDEEAEDGVEAEEEEENQLADDEGKSVGDDDEELEYL